MSNKPVQVKAALAETALGPWYRRIDRPDPNTSPLPQDSARHQNSPTCRAASNIGCRSDSEERVPILAWLCSSLGADRGPGLQPAKADEGLGYVACEEQDPPEAVSPECYIWSTAAPANAGSRC